MDSATGFLDALTNQKRNAFLLKWSKELSKQYKAFAKQNCRTWFSAAFSVKHTPLHITYNRRTKELNIYGQPPNLNINKHLASSAKRLPIPKGTKVKPFYLRSSTVAGGERTQSTKGIWLTPKTYQPHTNKLFFVKSSHSDIGVNEADHKYLKHGTPRRYPFPAAWANSGGEAHFERGTVALSDHIVNAPDFSQILFNAFDVTLAKFK